MPKRRNHQRRAGRKGDGEVICCHSPRFPLCLAPVRLITGCAEDGTAFEFWQCMNGHDQEPPAERPAPTVKAHPPRHGNGLQKSVVAEAVKASGLSPMDFFIDLIREHGPKQKSACEALGVVESTVGNYLSRLGLRWLEVLKEAVRRGAITADSARFNGCRVEIVPLMAIEAGVSEIEYVQMLARTHETCSEAAASIPIWPQHLYAHISRLGTTWKELRESVR